MTHIRPVVWAQGKRSLHHPLSQNDLPQHFISILEDDSPFQETLERVADPEFLPPLIVGSAQFKAFAQHQCDEIDIEYEAYLTLESDDPAEAFNAAAQWAAEQGEQNVPLLFCPTDHFIADGFAFLRATEYAAHTALQGYLVCFGAVASRIENAYDYLQVGPRLDASYAGHHILDHVEHPDFQQASALTEQGGYVWDTGLYCATAETLLASSSPKKCVTSLLTFWSKLSHWPGLWASRKFLLEHEEEEE